MILINCVFFCFNFETNIVGFSKRKFITMSKIFDTFNMRWVIFVWSKRNFRNITRHVYSAFQKTSTTENLRWILRDYLTNVPMYKNISHKEKYIFSLHKGRNFPDTFPEKEVKSRHHNQKNRRYEFYKRFQYTNGKVELLYSVTLIMNVYWNIVSLSFVIENFWYTWCDNFYRGICL